MPNWVMNELTCIFQTTEEYNAFKEKAKIEGLYNSFIPMPSVLENTRSPHIEPDAFIAGVNSRKNTTFITLDDVINSSDKWDADCAKEIARNVKAFSETGYHDWYAWNLDNWGVKWDACKCKIINDSLESNSITFAFDSPWGTPEHFVRELSKLYPDATFEMVSGSIENDSHYEFTCVNGKYEETCSYDNFREAVEDGKWGGWDEWAELFEESEEV
jgi:hypothetical protein